MAEGLPDDWYNGDEKTQNMVKSVLLTTIFSVALSLTAVLCAQGATVFIEPPEQIIHETGESITVHVRVSDVTDLFGFQFDLSFDPTIIEATDVAEGAFLKSSGGTFWNPPDINNKNGLLSKATAVLTGDAGGVTGGGILVSITFRVLELRASTLELRNVTLSDPDAKRIEANIVNGKIIPGLIDTGKWMLQDSGTEVNLWDVCFVNATQGWAVGDNGTILKTENGGLNWIRQYSGGTQKSILSVHFYDVNHGIVVGDDDTLLYANEGLIRWAFATLGEEYIWRGVQLISPNEGLIVGSSPWTSTTLGGSVTDRFKVFGPTHGPSMDETTTIVVQGEDAFFDVSFAGIYQGWVVGTDGAIYHTDDGGKTLTPQISGTHEDLFAVHFVNAKEGWVVGDNGTILRTKDGGAIWRSQQISVKNALRGVHFVSPDEGWAVGDNGTILHTTDGGTTWKIEPVNIRQNLNSIYFANANEGWAVGEGGAILKFTDTDVHRTTLEKEAVLRIGEQRFFQSSLACGLSPNLHNPSIDSTLPNFISLALQDASLSPGGSIDISYAIQISDYAPLGRHDGKITLAFPTNEGINCSAEIILRIITMGSFVDVAAAAKVADRGDGQTAAFIDYNNDGKLDIYLINFGKSNVLYRNNGDSTFTDVSAIAGLREPAYASCITVGDYDNDGYTDMYLASADGDILYHNNGNGTFSDVTAMAGIRGVGQAAAFSDFDNDGYLDLYVVSGGRANALYRNNGDGTFTDVTPLTPALSQRERGKGVGDIGMAYAVAIGDYDNDGDADIYVTNINRQNLLYRNNGDLTFTDGAFSAGVWNPPGSEFSAAFGDYDNDGYLDLYVASDAIDVIYRNNGNGTFSNFAFDAGVAEAENGRGMAFGDYDNDGDLDVYVVNFYVPGVSNKDQGNVLFLNKGDGTFQDISYDVNVADEGDGWAVTTGDYDNDGDLDLYVVKSNQPNLLYRNRLSDGNWLIVKLIGKESNRSGIGARITAIAGELKQIREINSSSQNGLVAHFGLDEHTQVDKLQIRWPSGTIQTLYNIPANQALEIEEKDIDSPSRIIDLSVDEITSNSVTLKWTAPGDDNDVGKSARYDVRYSTSPISETTWDSATKAEGEPVPADVGTPQSFTVERLFAETTYYFAMKTIDDEGNQSALSNVVQATTGKEGPLLSNVLNYPNPFNPTKTATTFKYTLGRSAKVTIRIFDMTGTLIRTVVKDAEKTHGIHIEDRWDGKDEYGNQAYHGMYIYNIVAVDIADGKNKKSVSQVLVIK